jgi:phage-related protein
MENYQKVRRVVFYQDHFEQFFLLQKNKVKEKILWTLELLENLLRIPETYLKHIENTDGLYEVRVQHGLDIFRIFCFFDEDKVVVVIISGFQKKQQKIPKKEIDKALKIKEAYENEK